MPKVSTRRVRSLVQARTPFKTHGALYARACGPHGYAVFSYGPHWPLHVWDGAQWIHNSGKRSVTTSRHHSVSYPGGGGPSLPCVAMRDLVTWLDLGLDRDRIKERLATLQGVTYG